VLRVMREQKLIRRRGPHEPRRRRPGFFQVTRPDEPRHLDMTSIWVAEHGRCCLDAAIDCCTRGIVGWSLELRCRAPGARLPNAEGGGRRPGGWPQIPKQMSGPGRPRLHCLRDPLAPLSAADRRDFHPLSVSLAGINFAQLSIGVLGVLVITGEYSTGMIRSTLAAVPRRLPMPWGKAVVFGATALANQPAGHLHRLSGSAGRSSPAKASTSRSATRGSSAR